MGSSTCRGRVLVRGRAIAVIVAAACLFATPARALDTDIFTGTQVDPNVLVVFDNSGSMGLQAYNTYPNTIYTGTYASGTVYSRCANKSGVSGGDVNANCTCRNVQTNWVVDNSACRTSVVDILPPPSGDDIDDRESRRKVGNRLNFETTPPKNCTLDPFDPCTSNAQCPGTGNLCSAQNKMAVAQGVMTSVINDPANANVRFGLMNFNPSGIDYNSMNYSSSTAITTWHVTNQNKFLVPVQDNTAVVALEPDHADLEHDGERRHADRAPPDRRVELLQRQRDQVRLVVAGAVHLPAQLRADGDRRHPRGGGRLQHDAAVLVHVQPRQGLRRQSR
ncbi:MAG: hypothetical protein U0842_11625 [Candidatus Binatia bacterium]